MSGLALPVDAVAIRRTRARGVSEMTLRRQLALVATPRVERFVFVRRVRLRAAPHGIAAAMQAALTQLADGGQEVLSYPDFPALVVACARAALAGGLGGGWQWRTLGLSPVAGLGEAVASLLAAHPLQAGSAVAALAEAGLLAPVWRQMPPRAAAELVRALAVAGGFSPPVWPADVTAAQTETRRAPEAVLQRAASVWTPALAGMSADSPLVLAAGVLALLRWFPGALRSGGGALWPALVARITAREPASEAARTDRRPVGPDDEGSPVAGAAPLDEAVPQGPVQPAGDAGVGEATETTASVNVATDIAETPRGERLATHWGGLLFLINALNRLDIAARLEACGPAAPTGWRVLLALGAAHGMPEAEPLSEFLAAQDVDTAMPPALMADLLAEIEALYRPDGPWPLPLRQLAWLTATETHLDISLGVASVDLVLRLSGLDLDPAWVPWLGRVVRFHYDSVATYAAALPAGGTARGATA